MKTKKFFKRALTLLLTLLMLLSTTSLGISAAQVELANTGVNHTGGYVYFLKPSTWTESKVMMFIGHNGYTSVYEMTKVANTDNLYRYTMPSWGGATYVAFANASSLWGSGSWGPSNRTNATHYTNVYNDYGFNSGSYYICVPASTANNAGLTINYKKSASDMNLAAEAKVYAAEAGSTTYSSNAEAGTVSIEGYYMSAYNTASSRSAGSSTTLAPASTATFKATPASGYKFVGWSTSSSASNIVSTDATYTYKYDISYSAKTVYALFEKEEIKYSYTASAGEGGSVSPTSGKVKAGESVTLTATPDTGYTFDKWTFTNGSGDENTATTTFTPSADGATAVASFKKNTYTVSASVSATPAGGNNTVTPTSTTVEHGGSVTFNATADTANEYVFTGWTIDGIDFAGDTTHTTLELTNITNNVSVTANFVQTKTFTVSASASPAEGAQSVSPTSQKVADGYPITLSATAKPGYRFDRWDITGTYTPQTGTVNSESFTIIPTSDVTAVAKFVKTWTVTFVGMNGTTIKTETVVNGASATAPTAPTVAHYTFTGWDTAFTNVTTDLIVKAQYTGNTYTVTVNNTTGGTAEADKNTVTYPDTVTITATPAEGYVLTGWTITGDKTDVSETSDSITIRPEANVTVTPSFVQGRKLTVYTYSANGYNNLTLTADSTNIIEGEEQTNTTDFNGVVWTNSGQQEIPPTATTITAQLEGTTTVDPTNSANWYKDGSFLSMDGYKTIICTNNHNWSPLKAYIWNSSTNQTYSGWSGTEMKKAYTNDQGQDVYVIVVKNDKNFNKVIFNNGSAQTVDLDLNSGNVSAYWIGNESNGKYAGTAWTAPTYNGSASASSGVISLTETLLPGGVWAGETEVWVTQEGKVTLRRDLLDLITQHTDLVNTNNSDGTYTADSWADYVTAYNAAVAESGQADATQANINDAYDALEAAYDALESESYVTVTYTQNFVPFEAKIGSTNITTATGTVRVVQGKALAVKFVAPTYYFIKSLKINGESVNIEGWTYEATLTFTTDTAIEIEYEENPEIKITENKATGGVVKFSNTVAKVNGKYLISYGYNTTFNITAPELYYIQSVFVNGQEVYSGTDETYKELENDYPISGVTADVNIIVTYGKCSTYKITIDAYPETSGKLYYNGELIPSEGTVIEVISGDTVTITAEPSDGYGIYYWVADSQTSGKEPTYTFSSITTDHTLDIEWIKLQQLTVTVVTKPAAAATSTVNNSSTAVVQQYSVLTLTTNCTDPRYSFVGWTIEGAYYNADNTTKSDTTYKIVASGGNIKATANYEKVMKAIYLKNDANWSNPQISYWGGSSAGPAWPGVNMTYNNSLGFWVGYVPFDATNVQFNDGTNQNQKEFVIGSNNLFTNGSDTTGFPTQFVEVGYYLDGRWDGKNHTTYDNVSFDYAGTDSNGYPIYTMELTVNSTEDGYIYVNPVNENSHFWNFIPGTENGNYVDTVCINQHTNTPERIKIKIDTENFNKAYDLFITFYPYTGDFTWTITENVPTITVIGTDGRGKNEADTNMSTPNGRVGDTYFDDDTVNRTEMHTYYTTAQVVAGNPVTFYTQVNKNTATNGYDYYVAGWVINGTEFVTATSLGNGKYSGSYIFSEDDTTVVPVYFHTNEWLTANSVETVTVYAVADRDITNWDQYLAAYTWYKIGGVTQYEQFGPWSGQLMIPVTGLDGVYYTIVETSTGDNVQISGITFNNYPSGDNIDNSAVTNYTNIQTYDYYEFIALLNDGKQNITFVIKDTNDTYNSDRVNGGTVSITDGNWDFVQYTDYSGLKIDIFGNNIESIDAGLNDTDALYIIQAGDKSVTNDTLDGQWYVECFLYDVTGKFLGKCYSYELHDEDSAIWTTIAAYENQRAYISYEHVNGARYDGEWYGDANVSVTINLSVKVALMGDDGKYVIDEDGDLNKAIYGEAFINDVQNVDVARGDVAHLTGMALKGYKFVGWYTADGKLFDTNLASDVTAAIGTHYVAVFEPLAEGSFYVNHYIYTGNGTASYRPPAHNGNAQLYVGIQNVTQGTTTSLLLGNSAGLAATEGDRLLITIATDGIGADKFYAWYTDAVDKYGKTTFEEVGVDSDDNLAFSDPNSQYYMNVSTVEGSIDRVYFQFWYTVGADDDFVLNFYSDLMPVSDKVTLIYQYTDRYGNPKSYYVKYQLNDDEIKGFAGNNNTEFTPAYISSTDNSWVNTILANAPYVEDYFKDTTWKINSSMYNTMTFLLWATQPETMYTVTTTVVTENGASVIVNKVPYNTVVDLDIRDLVPDASYTGYWYQDVNNNGTYEKTVDIILTYGPYYGYRVTQDMAINYQYVASDDDYKFNVSLDAPVYGREQTTDSSGGNSTDIVIIDYVINILTPYFYYNHPEFTPIYDGEEITDGSWGKTLVTIESLERAGYEVSYGVLLQQVGTFKIKDKYNNDFTAAEAAAKEKGYGTATDDATLIEFLNSGAAKGFIGETNTYGYVYDATEHNITNKNRVLFVLEQNNTSGNQNRFYNVYGYLTVTYNGVTTTYISNVQTLNIYNEGIKDAVVENNTSFA